MKIIKRDGRIVDYDKNKIRTAIQKANNEVTDKEKISDKDIDKIITYIESLNKKRMLVEDIQDIIEEKLMERKRYSLAKKYIIYRYTRSLVRKSNTTDSSLLSLIKNDSASQNSYITATTQRDILASQASKDLAYRILLPKNIVLNDQQGNIEFCSLNHFTEPIIDSCFIDINKILDNGIIINNIKIESPKSFQSICNIIVEVITAVASSQTGDIYLELSSLFKYYDVSFSKRKKRYVEFRDANIDEETIDAIVRESTREEVKSGIQTILYQINTISLPDGNTPKVNFLITCTDAKNEDQKYIIEEFLRQKSMGIVNYLNEIIIPEYPKVIYGYTDENDELLEDIIKLNTQSLFMNKRTYDLFKKHLSRFCQGTIVLNIDKSIENSDNIIQTALEKIDICYEGFLYINHSLQGTYSDKSPIHWQNGIIARLNKKERIDEYLKKDYSYFILNIKGLEAAINEHHEVSKIELINAINEKIESLNKVSNFSIIVSNYDATSNIDSEEFINNNYLDTPFKYCAYSKETDLSKNYIYIKKTE